MSKKRLIVIILFVLLLGIISFTLFYSTLEKNSSLKTNDENINNVINKNNELEKQDKEISTEIITKEHAEEKTIKESNNNENTISNSTIPIISQDVISTDNEDVNSYDDNNEIPTTSIVENKENIDEENNISNNKEETSVNNQEILPEEVIDAELEELKKQVEFSTYDECMQIGFDTALKDTINILGFSCPYIVYKGQILGYRLQLDYTNPMEN